MTAEKEPPDFGVVTIAWCPEHGLHGGRETCFDCGGEVVRVPMWQTTRGDLEDRVRALRREVNRCGGVVRTRWVLERLDNLFNEGGGR